MLGRMTPDLDALLAGTWQSLVDATTRRTPSTLAALATVAGETPQLRSVILRACDPGAGTVAFATDARSSKVAEIRANPAVALTVWDESTGVQVRLGGRATVDPDDAERRRRWDALGPHSQRGYGSPSVPGTTLAPEDDPAHPDAQDAWSDRFAWVEVRVDRVDRLDISADPHQRARFARDLSAWCGERVVP